MTDKVNKKIDNVRQRTDDGLGTGGQLMYGKHFASMYSGSMYGKPALVFAIWGYVISHFRPSRKDGQCYIELNPLLLAGVFASTPAEVMDAIAVLQSPDPGSRSKLEQGRRLILLDEERHLGPMQFKVVNGPKYREMRDEEDRREYLKEAQRLSRARKKAREAFTDPTLSTMSTAVNRRQPPSTQAEAEAEADPSPRLPSEDSEIPEAPKRKAPSARAGLVGDCARLWAARYHAEPTWASEAARLNKLALTKGKSEVVAAFGRFVASDDRWLVEQRHSLKAFLSNPDRWLVPDEPVTQERPSYIEAPPEWLEKQGYR